MNAGWQRVDAASPVGCSLAQQGIAARVYRSAIVPMTRTSIDGQQYHGTFTNSEMVCDSIDHLFFPEKFKHTNIFLHPVTHMPLVRKNALDRLYQILGDIHKPEINRTYGNKYEVYTPTNYAMEA